MLVRSYVPGDLEAVVKIADLAWRPIRKMTRAALGDAISDFLHPGGDAVSKGQEVRAQIAGGKYEILVCEEDGRLVGFLTFSVHGRMAEICNNAALPGTGLKGIGQAMYGAVLENLRNRGIRLVSVTTGLDEAHAPARRAYERAGFHRHLDSTTYFMDLQERISGTNQA